METLRHSVGDALGKKIDLVVRVEFRFKRQHVLKSFQKMEVHTKLDRSARGKIGYLCVGHRYFWILSADLSRVFTDFPKSGVAFNDVDAMEKDEDGYGVLIRTVQKFIAPPFPPATVIEAKKTSMDKSWHKGTTLNCWIVYAMHFEFRSCL